jgi:hypothetical protein
MTLKATKRMLALASLALFAASAWVLVWGLTPSTSQEDEKPAAAGPQSTAPSSSRPHAATKAVPAAPSPLITSANFAATQDRPLRRPLFDPPPPPSVIVQKKALAPIRARLLATMIEAENSTAVLRLASGEVVFRKVGEALGNTEPDAKVARIEPGVVSVSRAGDETRLMVDSVKSR